MESFAISAISGGVMLILCIVLLTGRGSFLIAGYNLMSKEKQARYDAPAYSKFMGKICIPIAIYTILVGIEALHVWWFWVVGGIIIAATLILACTAFFGNRFKR